MDSTSVFMNTAKVKVLKGLSIGKDSSFYAQDQMKQLEGICMYQFSIDRETDAPKMVLTISGEIDLFAAPEFREKLYEAVSDVSADVVLNCRDLSYIDSSGLGILLGALKRVRQNSHQVYIRYLKDSIKKLFIITGLDKAFVLEDVQ